MAQKLRIAAIGECMVELAKAGGESGLYERRFGGDTLNTAVYLARLLRSDAIHYVTRLGDDAISQWMLDGWRGYVVAQTAAAYAVYKRMRYYEMRRNPESRDMAAELLHGYGLDP